MLVKMLLPGLANHSLSHLNSPVGRLKIKKRVMTRSHTDTLLFATHSTDEGRRNAIAVEPGEYIREALKDAEQITENPKFTYLAKTPKGLSVYWNEREATGNLPTAREGSGMVMINRRVFMFGGLSRDLFNEVKVLRTDGWSWSQIVLNESSELPPEARFGHTMVPYRQKFVVYGGCGIFDKILRIRQCFSRVHIFDTGNPYAERAIWSTYKPLGETPEARRNHAAVSLGSSVVIYGGVNSNGKLLDDLQILNLETMNWLNPKVTNDSAKPGKLAYFTLTAVYPACIRNQSNFDIFHLPNVHDEIFNPKNSGIYMFGGIDRNGKVKNTVYVLRIKRFNSHGDGLLRWVQLTPAGQPPQARYSHTATLVGKHLIILGGRTDVMTSMGGYDVTEIAALNIEACSWETVNIKGDYPGGRWGACSTCLGSSLLYFGGMRLEKYSKSKIWVMETDSYNVGMLVARDAEAMYQEQAPIIKRKIKAI